MEKPLVLIVDDNVIALKLLRKFFEASEVVVIEATDGHQCVELATTKLPDVILLDLMMPMLDGYGTIKKLKENPATRNIPVIILTALSDTDNQQRAVDSGADDFLSKPIEEKLIVSKVKLFAQLSCYRRLNDELKNELRKAIDAGFVPSDDVASICK